MSFREKAVGDPDCVRTVEVHIGESVRGATKDHANVAVASGVAADVSLRMPEMLPSIFLRPLSPPGIEDRSPASGLVGKPSRERIGMRLCMHVHWRDPLLTAA